MRALIPWDAQFAVKWLALAVAVAAGLLGVTLAQHQRIGALEDDAGWCRARRKEDLDFCAEEINERAKHQNELATAFCRERVAGCGTLISLNRRSDGVYECRCR